MATTSLHISLSDKLKEEVHHQVEEGCFSNPTDYVRHLIRQDVLRKKAKAEFKAYITKGMASPSCGQTPAQMIADLKDRINQQG